MAAWKRQKADLKKLKENKEAASSTQCAPNLASSHGVLGIFGLS